MSNWRTERNKQVKAIVAKAFAPHKVSVRGSRGTAYGWTHIDIAYAPRTIAERRELERLLWQAFDAAKIKFGTYYSDDPSCTEHPQVIIDFQRPEGGYPQ